MGRRAEVRLFDWREESKMQSEDKFDPIYYLYANPDVAATRWDPFEHFEKHGKIEGRQYALTKLPSQLEAEFLARREFFQKSFHMLDYNGISGDYVEFGSGGGATLITALRLSTNSQSNRTFWTFDSFKGLPHSVSADDEHPQWSSGVYAVSEDDYRRRCELAGIDMQRVRMIAGFYESSLIQPDVEYPSDIAIAYIDCDLFSSSRAVLNFLRSRLKNGMVIAFDDYYCHTSSGRSGEQKAFELFRGELRSFEFERYLSIGWHGQSFISYKID